MLQTKEENMRVNSISDASVNNKQNFGVIKKIKLSGIYANKPELTDDILYVYLHKSFENTQEFLKKYDVNVTLNAQPKEFPLPKDIWEFLDGFFVERTPALCQHSIEFEILPQNASFFKSLFKRKDKIQVDTFDTYWCFRSFTPPTRILADGAEKINKALARFVPDVQKAESKPIKTMYIMKGGKAFETKDYSIFKRGAIEYDSAMPCERFVWKYRNGTIKKNETNAIHRLANEQKNLTNYKGYAAKYSCFEYYPNGNMKEYVVVGDKQECFGEFYENGKRKFDLVLNQEQHSEGIGAYYITTGRLRTYDESGSLIDDKSKKRENWITPIDLLYTRMDQRSSSIKQNAMRTMEEP